MATNGFHPYGGSAGLPRIADMSEIPPGLNKNHNFNKLWFGQSISLIGTNVSYLAVPLLAIFAIDAGALELGLIGLAETAPFLLVTLWAGAWIDGRRRIPVMLVSDVIRAAILVLIAALALVGMLNLAIIIVLMFVFGVFSVLFEVAYYSILPSVVHRSDLLQANGRLQTSLSVAWAVGPNIGGWVTQLMAAPFAILVDAVTFVLSYGALKRMRVTEKITVPEGPRESRARQIREGLVYVWRKPVLRAITASSALYNLFTNWVMTLWPVFAVRQLELSPGMIGFVGSCGVIGSVVGAVIAVRIIKAAGAGPTYVWTKAVAWLSVLSLGLVPAHSPFTIPLLGLAFAFSGFLVVSNVVSVTLRQVITSDVMLGRMTATYKFVSFGAMALGAFIAGIAGEILGLRTAMIVGGIGLVTTVLVALTPTLLRIRDLPEQPPEESSPAAEPEPVKVGS
jgi:MFS family permease